MGDRYNYRSDEQRGREVRPYQPQSHQSDWDEPRRGSSSRMSANDDWNNNEDEPLRDREWRGDRSFRDRSEGRDDDRWAGDGGQFRHTDESGNFNAGGRSYRREGDRDRAMGNGAAGYPGGSRGQSGMNGGRGNYAAEGWSGHYYGNNRGSQQNSNYSGGGNYRSGGSQTSGQSYGGDYYGGGMGGGSYERDYQGGGNYGGRQGSWTQAGYNAGAQGGSWGGRNYDSGESYGRGDRWQGDRSQGDRWQNDRWQNDGNNQSAGRNFGRGDWSNSSNVGGTGYGARGMGRGSYESRDWNAGAGAESDWSEQRGEGRRDTGNMWNVGGRHAGKGPKGYTRSDDRIKEELNDRLTSHGDIDASELEVQVMNGEVTLTGTVDSRDAKRMAEDLADQIQGVRQVSNQLRVERQAEQEMPGAQSQYGRAVSTRPNGGADSGRSASSTDTSGSDTETGVREGSETASASGSTQSGADRSTKVTGKSDKSDKSDRSH